MKNAEKEKLESEVKRELADLQERAKGVRHKLELLGSKKFDVKWPTAEEIEGGGSEYEVTQRFTFDAGHYLTKHPKRQKGYGTPHGHSWTCYVTLRGKPGRFGWLMDFGRFETLLLRVRALLDHKELNKIAGLEQPTMEHISRAIGLTILRALPIYSRNRTLRLVKVRLCRESIGEECVWFADD